jgi:hypothetical protein
MVSFWFAEATTVGVSERNPAALDRIAPYPRSAISALGYGPLGGYRMLREYQPISESFDEFRYP